MDPIVLFKIGSLHARTVQEDGLKIRHRGREVSTGTIVAHLDDTAEIPANMGMVDLATGTIQLRWGVIAALPLLADAFASGSVAAKESAPVRATLEETGRVLEDGSAFDVKGTGRIGPGSLLSPARIMAHNNIVKILVDGRAATMRRALAAGNVVRCAFVPESSTLDLALPKSLGGGTQRLNLAGGFSLVPVMTLERPERARRSRR
jgi:hypothetical protein